MMASFSYELVLGISAERKAVDFLHDKWLEYFHDGNGEGIATLYTDDMMSLAPGKEIIVGKEGLVELFNKMFEAAGGKGLDTEQTIDSFDVVGDYIYLTGTHKIFTKGDRKLLDHESQLEIFKKVDGKWLFHRDIWCDDGPIPSEEQS